MATDQSLLMIDRPSATDLSSNQFYLADVDANGNFALVNTAGQRVAGVIQVSGIGAGASCVVGVIGVSKCALGGTVAAGSSVKADATGRAVSASAGDIANGLAFGICTIGGAVGNVGSIELTLGANGIVGVGGSDTLSASGAASLNTSTTLLSTSGTFAYTLANGNTVGQKKTFREITGTGTGTLTIATTHNSEPTVYVFHAATQEAEFEWMADGWKLIRKIRAGALTVVVGTTVLTGYLLTETFNPSVTGTVTSTGTMAVPAPTLPGEYIRVITTVAASTPVGSLAIAGFTKALVAATAFAGINATTCTGTFISNGVSWDNSQLTTATYS